MPKTQPKKQLISAVVIGGECAGKTQLINRLAGIAFNSTHKTSIGGDFKTREYTHGQIQASIQFWDTPGRRDHEVGTAYFRSANVILCAVDLTAKDGLNAEALTTKISFAIQSAHHPENLRVVIVGTKAGSSAPRTISDDDLERYIDESITAGTYQLEQNAILTDAESNAGIDKLCETVFKLANKAYTVTNHSSTQQHDINALIHQLCSLKDSNSHLLAEKLLEFTNQIPVVKLSQVKRDRCKMVVFDAVKTICFDDTANEKTKIAALKKLHAAANLSPSVRKIKALSICMMAIGALLTTIGTLSLLVSTGMITTGVLAPLGVLTAAGAGAMTCFGVTITAVGAGLFATRHKLKNPLRSLKTIETTLKKQTNVKK